MNETHDRIDSPFTDGPSPDDTFAAQDSGRPASSAAGTYVNPPAPTPQSRRLERTDGPLGGVAGGIAKYFDVDPTLVRIGLVVGTLAYGSGVFLYLAAWLIVPKAAQPTPPPPVLSNAVPSNAVPSNAVPSNDGAIDSY